MAVLLVASTGGHLAQLHALRPRLVAADEDVLWVTFDTPQSRSLLAGEPVLHLDEIAPRAVGAVLRGAVRTARALRGRELDRLYSTGSAIALAVVPVARARGVACHYIESAARSEGPSLTGRIMARLPGVSTSTQYRAWASDRWPVTVSVFDAFGPDEPVALRPVTSVVVTLGTIAGFGFPALLERVRQIAPPGTEVLWQTGATAAPASALPGRVVATLPQAELVQAIADADVVIAHAGVGSALAALQLGRTPLLVPRRATRGEHVDDHQVQVARELAGRGLAVHRELERLTWDDVVAAAAGRNRVVTLSN